MTREVARCFSNQVPSHVHGWDTAQASDTRPSEKHLSVRLAPLSSDLEVPSVSATSDRRSGGQAAWPLGPRRVNIIHPLPESDQSIPGAGALSHTTSVYYLHISTPHCRAGRQWRARAVYAESIAIASISVQATRMVDNHMIRCNRLLHIVHGWNTLQGMQPTTTVH
jgi:hypothetical protein